jgi:tetratricopeptide (TPR) repeat protein
MVRTGSHFTVVVLLLGLARAAAADDEPLAEAAKARFDQGVELASQGDYEGALQAFRDAHAASPNVAVLYNIGQAEVALGRPVEAAATLSRYLREGGDSVPPERRRQVKEQLELLESFIVDLDVTLPPNARISVDGREVGRSPLAEPVRLTAGRHKVDASLDEAPPSNAQPTECPAVRTIVDTPAPATPSSERGGLRAAMPYALIGAGVALGASALGVYLWKREDYERWQAGETTLRTETPGSSSYQALAAENQRLAASLSTANRAIVGLSVAGGVMVAVGASLYLIDRAATRRLTSLTVAWNGGSSVAAGWRYRW